MGGDEVECGLKGDVGGGDGETLSRGGDADLNSEGGFFGFVVLGGA